MSKPLDSLILERLYAKEATLVSHANAIDQKANYLLVAITFLGLQISGLLGKAWLSAWRWELFASAALLLAAAAFVAQGTRLANYDDEGAEKLEAWRDEGLRLGETEETMLYALRYAARERTEAVKSLLRRRACAIERAFYLTVAAFVLNTACAIGLTFL